jgi:DNA-binding CsgD family transcriptional regulator
MTTERKPARSIIGSMSPARLSPEEEEQELFVRAGYEPVKAIAQKLKRSEHSVRFRLKGRAISARVTGSWSLRRIQQTLHISHRRLQRLIGNGFLRVRDPWISAISLAKFCRKYGTAALPIAKYTKFLACRRSGSTPLFLSLPSIALSPSRSLGVPGNSRHPAQ